MMSAHVKHTTAKSNHELAALWCMSGGGAVVLAMAEYEWRHVRSLIVLHGESITDQAPPRTPTQRTFQPQEAVQPQRNQTILQADTPVQKANYSYKRSDPTPLEADAHTSHVHKNAPARTQSPGGRPPSTCTHRTSQSAEVADATTIRTPPASCQWHRCRSIRKQSV